MPKDPYSPKGTWPLRPNQARHKAHEKKSGPEKESTAEAGHSSGPISGRDVTIVREGIGGLLDQEEDTPVGDDGFIKRVVDEHGRRWLYVRFFNPGSQEFDWYCIRLSHPTEDPTFEVPTDGTIDVGGIPTQRPITATGGALVIPTASTAIRATIEINGVAIPVVQLAQAGTPTCQFSVPVPEGYNLEPLIARFYWYSVTGSFGSGTIGIRAMGYGAGEDVVAFSGSFIEVTSANDVLIGGLNVTILTAEFTPVVPVGTLERGDDMHFEIRRNGGTYPDSMDLSKVQVFYERDRFSDVVS